jgi:nucleotide-binding universal stress UspA family protein
VTPSLDTERRAPDPPVDSGGRSARPVMLATLAVPFDPDAARIALQAAMESDCKLIVVDAVEQPFFPLSLALGYGAFEEDQDRERIRETVERAARLGLEVEHLRVRSPRPVEALLELAGERNTGLLVFGPDRSRLRPRLFARIVRRVRRRASCLLWIAGEGP